MIHKLRIRREYLKLRAMVDERGADCGASLLGYISPDCMRQAAKVVRLLEAQRKRDPDAPATPLWIREMAGLATSQAQVKG